MSVLRTRLSEIGGVLEQLGSIEEAFDSAARGVAASLRAGGKLLAAGNGGSAAEAQHLTSEFLGRLAPARDRVPLAAVALHGDSSTMTALANDYGFESVYARQVQALGRAEDTLVVLSTSGGSRNLVRAVESANAIGMTTVAFLGAGDRPLHSLCSHVLAVPSESVPAIQESHLVLVHALVEQVEEILKADGF